MPVSTLAPIREVPNNGVDSTNPSQNIRRRSAGDSAFAGDGPPPAMNATPLPPVTTSPGRGAIDSRAKQYQWRIASNAELTHSHREGSVGSQSDIQSFRTLRNGKRGWLLRGAFCSAFSFPFAPLLPIFAVFATFCGERGQFTEASKGSKGPKQRSTIDRQLCSRGVIVLQCAPG
jgi:hypothetical protein